LLPFQPRTYYGNKTIAEFSESIDGGKQWHNVGEKMVHANFGFAIAVADDNPDQAWVAPATSDETE
jgi:hypothetical protein